MQAQLQRLCRALSEAFDLVEGGVTTSRVGKLTEATVKRRWRSRRSSTGSLDSSAVEGLIAMLECSGRRLTDESMPCVTSETLFVARSIRSDSEPPRPRPSIRAHSCADPRSELRSFTALLMICSELLKRD